jgi:hypothetical protein
MELIGADFRWTQQLWRLAEVAGKLGNLLNVRDPMMVQRRSER